MTRVRRRLCVFQSLPDEGAVAAGAPKPVVDVAGAAAPKENPPVLGAAAAVGFAKPANPPPPKLISGKTSATAQCNLCKILSTLSLFLNVYFSSAHFSQPARRGRG